jgi:hypothetical protein
VLVVGLLIVIIGSAVVDPSRIWLLLIPISFLVAAHEAGFFLERWFDGRPVATDAAVIPVIAIRIGIGIAALSLLASWSGWLGIFPLAGVATVGCLLSGCRRSLMRVVQAGLNGLRLSFSQASAGVIAGCAWLVAWLWATTPPIFFDELSYHFVVPQRAIATGSLPAFPWVFFTLMPHAADVLLAWGMGLGGMLEWMGSVGSGVGLGGRAMVWTLWLACSIGAWGLVEAILWPQKSVWCAPMIMAALAACPLLWFLATLPFGESCTSIGILTAALVLVQSQSAEAHQSGRRFGILLGLALGFVVTTKLTGVYWMAAALAAAMVGGWSWSRIALSSLIAMMSGAFWWGRSLIQTGNPIYPMAYDLFGGKYWSAESQARVMGDVATRAGDLGLNGLLRLPWDLVQHPERFGSASDLGAPAALALAVIMGLPILVRFMNVDMRMRRLSDMAAIFVIIAAVGWVCTSTVTRFFAPGLILCLSGVAAMLLHVRRSLAPVALASTLVVGLWGMNRFINEHAEAFSSRDVAVGNETRDAYLTRQLDHFAAARFVRDQLPSGARLLFIGETRPYYFDRESLAPTAYDGHPLTGWVREAVTTEALADRLADEGFSHVILNMREFKRLHDSYGLLAFAANGDESSERRLKELPAKLTLLFSHNGVYVFEVPARKPLAKRMELSRG